MHITIKYMQKTSRLLIVIMADVLLIMSHVQAAVLCDKGAS